MVSCLESTCASYPRNRSGNAFQTSEESSVLDSTGLDDLSLFVSPHAVLVAHQTVFPRILVRVDPVVPFAGELRGIDEHVDLLRMEPGLGVLVPVTDDDDLVIYAHEFY